MHVRVYLVGWMKAITEAVLKHPLELRDTLPTGVEPSEDDDFSEDRDTWPEAGLADSRGLPLAELRIDLSGSPRDLDGRAQHLIAAIEREVRSVTAEWGVNVRVTPQGKD